MKFLKYLLVFVMGVAAHYAYNDYKLNSNKSLVVASFDIFGPESAEGVIAKYHAPSYMQYADGEVLDYDGLVAHVRSVKNRVDTVDITYDHILAEGDKVCTVHTANAVKKDGSKAQIKVIALHGIEDGKIIFTDELTYMVEGESSDSDLGSSIE